MPAYETVTAGRAKRSTAGNRMCELLEQAHQEDDDELFAEVENDEEFEAPQETRDVFLDEFADTDEEMEDDEEAMERALQREERRKEKGKSRAIYNPLASQPKPKKPSDPSSLSNRLEDPTLSLLDPTIDPSSMAPSTLMMALRKQRREAKRLNRSEARRSNLRASTLKTEDEIKAREEAERASRGNKGRRPQHETGEVRGLRPMTQDELIAAALEEEERNKEALRDWLRKEDEKRELRRVGRKRVRGPRWTWISKTVGKLVEVVGETEAEVEKPLAKAHKLLTPLEDEQKATKTEPEELVKSPGEAGAPSNTGLGEAPSAHDIAPSGEKDLIQADVVQTDDMGASVKENDPTSPIGLAASSAVISDVSIVIDPPAESSSHAGPVSSSKTASNQLFPVEPGPSSPRTTVVDPSARPIVDSIDEPLALTVSTSKSEAEEETKLSDGAPPSLRSLQPEPSSLSQSGTETNHPNVGPMSRPQTGASEHLEAGSSAQLAAEHPISNPGQSDPLAPALLPNATSKPSTPPAQPNPQVEETSQQYTRNYLILSQVPGGLPAELKLVLGDHVEWDEVMYIPARNRHIIRRPPICQFTGLPAKYRHPTTMIPYATTEGYKAIEALLANRYVYDEGGWWAGGEEDTCAEGMEGIDGWWEGVNKGWLGGKEIIPEPKAEPEQEPKVVSEAAMEEGQPMIQDDTEEAEEEAPTTKSRSKSRAKRKRADEYDEVIVESIPKKAKSKKVKLEVVDQDMQAETPPKKGKAKSKKK